MHDRRKENKIVRGQNDLIYTFKIFQIIVGVLNSNNNTIMSFYKKKTGYFLLRQRQKETFKSIQSITSSNTFKNSLKKTFKYIYLSLSPSLTQKKSLTLTIRAQRQFRRCLFRNFNKICQQQSHKKEVSCKLTFSKGKSCVGNNRNTYMKKLSLYPSIVYVS